MEIQFVVFIILIILMIIYGRHNKIKNINYNNTQYFKNLKNIIKFENKIKKKIKNDLNIAFEDITKKIDIHTIPNLQHVYYVDLNPFSSFTINNLNTENNLMIVINHTDKNLDLIIKKKNNYSYLYNFNGNINVLDIFPIYNNNDVVVSITIFILKKPYWMV
jgi:hypothetical protein